MAGFSVADIASATAANALEKARRDEDRISDLEKRVAALEAEIARLKRGPL